MTIWTLVWTQDNLALASFPSISIPQASADSWFLHLSLQMFAFFLSCFLWLPFGDWLYLSEFYTVLVPCSYLEDYIICTIWQALLIWRTSVKFAVLLNEFGICHKMRKLKLIGLRGLFKTLGFCWTNWVRETSVLRICQTRLWKRGKY